MSDTARIYTPAQLEEAVEYKKKYLSTMSIEDIVAMLHPETFIAPTTVVSTLEARGSRYGDFADHARQTQLIMTALQMGPNWNALPDVHRQALTVIADKLGRILTGDFNYEDNWHDLQGYARLVEKFIQSGGTTCLKE